MTHLHFDGIKDVFKIPFLLLLRTSIVGGSCAAVLNLAVHARGLGPATIGHQRCV